MSKALPTFIASGLAGLIFLGSATAATACACPQMTLKVSDLLNKESAAVANWPDNAVAVAGMTIAQELVDEHASFAILDTTFSVRKTLAGRPLQRIRFRQGQSSCDVNLRIAETVVLVFREQQEGWRLLSCDQAMMDVTLRDVFSAVR